jgi:hypothetical protein
VPAEAVLSVTDDTGSDWPVHTNAVSKSITMIVTMTCVGIRVEWSLRVVKAFA